MQTHTRWLGPYQVAHEAQKSMRRNQATRQDHLEARDRADGNVYVCVRVCVCVACVCGVHVCVVCVWCVVCVCVRVMTEGGIK